MSEVDQEVRLQSWRADVESTGISISKSIAGNELTCYRGIDVSDRATGAVHYYLPSSVSALVQLTAVVTARHRQIEINEMRGVLSKAGVWAHVAYVRAAAEQIFKNFILFPHVRVLHDVAEASVTRRQPLETLVEAVREGSMEENRSSLLELVRRAAAYRRDGQEQEAETAVDAAKTAFRRYKKNILTDPSTESSEFKQRELMVYNYCEFKAAEYDDLRRLEADAIADAEARMTIFRELTDMMYK